MAKRVILEIEPFCEMLIVAGSLRRRKEEVGDVEIVYVPKMERVMRVAQSDFLASPPPVFSNQVDKKLAEMIQTGKLLKRCNSLGSEIWGDQNKLARDPETRIPIDFFSCEEPHWWSLVVCRTGGKQNNIRLCAAAKEKGWHWNPYLGFWDQEGTLIKPESEQHVFELVGIPYKEPWMRE